MTFELYVVVAKSPSGSTACMEVVQGEKKLASRVEELEMTDHDVQVYKTRKVKHEIFTEVVGIEIYEDNP